MPQECCSSLRKNRRMITQLKEHSLMLKNVFPFFYFSELEPWSSWMKYGTGQPTIKWRSSLQRECTALNWAKVLKRRLLFQNYCVKILGLLQLSEIFVSRKNSWQKSTLKVHFYNKWNLFKMPFLLNSSWTTPSKCPITSLFICLPLTACCNKKSPLDKRKLQNFIPTVTSQPLPITSPFMIKTFSTEPRGKNSAHRTPTGWGFIEVFRTSQEKVRRISLHL